MKNSSKTILILIFLILLILIFFIITGINVSKPEQAAQQLIEKIVDFNRALNMAVRNFFYSIRSSFQERFSR